MYKTYEGKMVNVYLLGDKGETELLEKGWRIALANFRETEQELYDRLIKTYRCVRVWRRATRIRGYHDIFAMVKR